VEDSQDVRAVVFDTNVFGKKGSINIDLLERWARLAQEENLQIWLPEPVLWEAAVHAAEQLRKLRDFSRSLLNFCREPDVQWWRFLIMDLEPI
jgi:hypothetical protein